MVRWIKLASQSGSDVVLELVRGLDLPVALYEADSVVETELVATTTPPVTATAGSLVLQPQPEELAATPVALLSIAVNPVPSVLLCSTEIRAALEGVPSIPDVYSFDPHTHEFSLFNFASLNDCGVGPAEQQPVLAATFLLEVPQSVISHFTLSEVGLLYCLATNGRKAV